MARVYDKVFLSTQVPPKPKRIVVCCDGTWQSATSLDPKQGCPSNVARLSRVLAKAGIDQDGKEWQQIVYYDAGVGTGDITEAEKKRQGGLGIGLLENVIEAYNFIVNNYTPGDELFFFGFSRGAYTVRAASGLVSMIGIITPASMRKFLTLYNAYIQAEKFEKDFAHSEDWQKWTALYPDYLVSKPDDITIQVIGVFDTVGAMGVPDMGHTQYTRIDMSRTRKKYEFIDTRLSPQVRHAYQALALDEQRDSFKPCVWTLKSDTPKEDQAGGASKPRPSTKLCQCWFPGAHINVGGGSSANADEEKSTGDREQLASISYAWMLDRVRPHLAYDEAALKVQKGEILANIKYGQTIVEKKEESAGWFWGSVEYAKNAIVGAPKKVANLLPAGMGFVDDSHTLLYDVMGTPTPRTPGEYNKAYEYTVERVHPSVYFRQVYQKENPQKDQEIYQPAAMKGWVRVWEENGFGKDEQKRKGWKWVKYAVDKAGKPTSKIEKSMWEFEIGHMPADDSIEKWLIDNSWSEKVHRDVQKGWRDS